ncbi:MAG: 3'-5' exonuclease [Treponemataceae bacterium]|nr:3'-5' exonuclease [Treponemataceae bacterium]
MVYTAIDTETTGLSRYTERIVEIGAVKFTKDGIIGEYSKLIYPEKKVPPQIIQIHGISDEMLDGKPLFRDIAQDFVSFIEGTTLIAHNAPFDIGFINKELNIAGLGELTNTKFSIDTLILSRKVFPESRKHTLQFLAESLQIPKGTAHRATDDARVCMELFHKCIIHAEQPPGR